MSTYISRIRPRKQAVVTGRIASLERYDKFYDLTWEALDKRAFPMLATNAGQVFVRVANSAHTADLQAARTVPPAPFSAGSLHNRYSGIRPDGTPGQGALYMASLPGLLRELTHYQTGGGKAGLALPGGADTTQAFMLGQTQGASAAGNRFYVYASARELHFADVRLSAPAVQRFFTALASHPGQRRRYGLSDNVSAEFLLNALLADDDTSAARGLADAVVDFHGAKDLALDGLAADSARADSDFGLLYRTFGGDVAGTNYIFFAAPGAVVTDLVPLEAFDTFKDLEAFVASL